MVLLLWYSKLSKQGKMSKRQMLMLADVQSVENTCKTDPACPFVGEYLELSMWLYCECECDCVNMMLQLCMHIWRTPAAYHRVDYARWFTFLWEEEWSWTILVIIVVKCNLLWCVGICQTCEIDIRKQTQNQLDKKNYVSSYES